MKYRYCKIIFAVLLLTVLCSCACRHMWTPADCLNPQVCTKCNETGSPALGHDWTDATCTAPQTCTRCGIAQGETLAHSYGDWVFGAEEMSHSCIICGYEETSKLDHELYLKTVLPGHWDLFSVDLHGGIYSGAAVLSTEYDLTSYMVFGENRACRIRLNNVFENLDRDITGAWSIAAYRQVEGMRNYILRISLSEPCFGNWVLTVVLAIPDDGDMKLSIEFEQGEHPFIMTFYREKQEVIDSVSGNWGISSPSADKSYCFQFRPDRTVTCYVDGIFEGTWTLGANPYDPAELGFCIQYVRDGKNEVFQGYVQLPQTEEEAPELYLFGGSKNFTFRQIDEAELAVIQGATDYLSGSWASVAYDTPNPALAAELNGDYSIRFEGGNFTLCHSSGKTYSGSWQAFSCKEHHYQYYLYFQALKESANCTLVVTADGLTLSIDLPESLGSKKQLYFRRMEDADVTGISLPVGTWSTENGGANLTFHEDGTFSGFLGWDASGTWLYIRHTDSTVYSETDSYDVIFWDYQLRFDDGSAPAMLQIEDMYPDRFSVTFANQPPLHFQRVAGQN